MSDQVTMSQAEFNQAIELAVTKSQLISLSTAFNSHEEEVGGLLKDIARDVKTLTVDVQGWELKMNVCKQELESDIYSELEHNFVTKKDLLNSEEKLKSDLGAFAKQVKWSVAGFMAAFTTISIIANVIVLTAKIPGVLE